MWQYLKGLFAKPPMLTPEEEAEDKDPGAIASVMNEDNGISGTGRASDVVQSRQFHEEFLAQVCVRPGVRLIEQLEATGAANVIDWFRPETPEPEPKALMQLFVKLAREGRTLGELPGIDLFISGRWSQGGGCSERSSEALMYLVRAIGRPMNVFYQATPRSDQFQHVTIEPEGERN